MVFIILVLSELVNAFNCRSDYLSLFTVGFFGNRFLIASVFISLDDGGGDPVAPPLFHTRPLDLGDWLLAVGLSLTLLPVVEVTKWTVRRRDRSRRPPALAG